jgi:3-deoxy-D-manno-octulosonate 8-phosphate phosphatase (KDO 8-P phosphatase)
MNFFAKNIAFLRAYKGLAVAHLAETLHVQPESLVELEAGQTEPSLDELVSISRTLNCPIDRLLMQDIADYYARGRSLDIRLVLLDVDGTLTEGGMFYTEAGDEFKRFDVHDGLAISRVARRTPLQFGIITAASRTQAARARAEQLHIRHFYGGTEPKLLVANRWLSELGLTLEQVAYIGDDLNDLELLRRVGLSACPADACPQVKQAVHVVLEHRGGHGCVREFLEAILGIDLEALSVHHSLPDTP